MGINVLFCVFRCLLSSLSFVAWCLFLLSSALFPVFLAPPLRSSRLKSGQYNVPAVGFSLLRICSFFFSSLRLRVLAFNLLASPRPPDSYLEGEMVKYKVKLVARKFVIFLTS